MKFGKRALSLVLCLVMIFTLLPFGMITASAAGESVTFTDNSVLLRSVDIPESVTVGDKVSAKVFTAIGDSFQNIFKSIFD